MFFRASLYAGTPLIFFADTGGGTCSISPRIGARHASICSTVILGAESGPHGSPARSYVEVANPKRTTASYSFSDRSQKRASLVACPIMRGNTPVAIGSSVPRCPTRRVPAIPRILLTTSCDVHPSGLSTTITPSRFTAATARFTSAVPVPQSISGPRFRPRRSCADRVCPSCPAEYARRCSANRNRSGRPRAHRR